MLEAGSAIEIVVLFVVGMEFSIVQTILGSNGRSWCRGLDLGSIDGIHIIELDQIAQSLPVLAFVISNVDKDIIERRQFGSSLAVGSLVVNALDGAKQVKQERIVLFVVLASNVWNGCRLEAFLVIGRELAVGVKGVVLNELGQVVGGWLVPGVNDNDIPVVKEGHGLGNGSVNDAGISAQALHDEQVVEFVVGLGIVGSHSVNEGEMDRFESEFRWHGQMNSCKNLLFFCNFLELLRVLVTTLSFNTHRSDMLSYRSPKVSRRCMTLK